MKKLLPMLALLTLTGCANQDNASDDNRYQYPIREVEYKGHSYIIFKGSPGAAYGHSSGCYSGAVHDPDCAQCKQHNREEDGK